jgi:hypothetical protein
MVSYGQLQLGLGSTVIVITLFFITLFFINLIAAPHIVITIILPLAHINRARMFGLLYLHKLVSSKRVVHKIVLTLSRIPWK